MNEVATAFAGEHEMELTCKWITLANRHYYMYLGKALAPYGLNAGQHLFVIALCKEPGVTQDKLPERIGVNKSTVTRALGQLEQSGFIRRVSNPQDKRTTCVLPTARAHAVIPRIMEVVSRWDAAVTAQYSESEKQALQSLLQRLVASAKTFGQESEPPPVEYDKGD